MKKEKLLENIRIYASNRMLYGAVFLLIVVGVFMYVILGSNMFLVTVDGNNRAVVSVRNDMQGIIDLTGVTLAEDDVVEFTAANSTSAGELTVRRAFYVTVTADSVSETISVIEGTVRDALETCGIVMGEYDEVSPSLDSHLSGEMKIKVSRVTYETRLAEESIPYTTREYKSINHIKKTRTVTQKGEKGVKTTTYRDKYVDGVLDSSKVMSVKTTKKPVEELIAVGTSTQKLIEKYKVLEQLKANGGPPTEYSEVYTMEGTAYTYSSVDKYNTTAVGTPVREGAVAVDPRVIPYGTILYVESVDGKYVYGYCVAEDTGGGIKGQRIDLFYESAAVMNKFGRRQVRVYVVG